MSSFKDIAYLILNDQFGFCLFEVFLLILFLYAIWKDRIHQDRSVVSGVWRGEKSKRIFLISANIFITLVVSVVFNITSYLKDGKVLLYFLNLGIIIYLFLYSGWFTNKLIGWWIKFEKRNFNPYGQ